MNFTATNRFGELSLLAEFKKTGGLSKPVLNALVFRLLGLALIFTLQVILARMMGPAQYGDYTVIITTVNLLLVFSIFGFDSSVLRFVPSYIGKSDYDSAHGFVKFSYRTVLTFAIISSAGIFAFLVAKSHSFRISFSEGFFWGILLIPFLAIMYQASAVLRALQRIKLSLLPVYFLFPVAMALACIYYYSNHKKLTVDAAMLINLLCTAIICLYIYRRAKRAMTEKAPAQAVNYSRTKWFGVSGVLFLTTAVDLLLRQSDILMVSYFMGNTDAGFYAVAARLATLTSLGLSVADYVFMPKLSSLFENKQLIKLQQLVRNSSLQILSITLPVVCLLIIGGHGVLAFFGDQFTKAYVPLVILLCGQIINSATGMVGGLMTMTGYQKTFFCFYLIAFAIQAGLNVLLIPAIGITGAAIGTSLSIIVLNLLAYFFVKKKLKIRASFL